MKISMLETVFCQTGTYNKGKVYNVDDVFGQACVDSNHAKLLPLNKPSKKEEPKFEPETKAE